MVRLSRCYSKWPWQEETTSGVHADLARFESFGKHQWLIYNFVAEKETQVRWDLGSNPINSGWEFKTL
ncbi:hypothetical protein SADUNF_Sadunf04G0135300 [Salix dunnii]|uniref:Uncharacterized protein n=1 Tax=Salix dunnii TaxID=1413687 RepID=A0A835K7I8_9ROSI|nr:hypothetical protein SADUNF_Sadunf04G0135300 [Salix dunnii]